ncbi:hypothetical protein Pmar_PMAR018619 [Perkinsus marinus ATCC 50983]|uniref:Uncharacterized protein n=1 Tax=Perkinsus marinus (strain ATCC 50983 / TXsc) TaxID=423536 RepID=C5L0B6_PERM5|nr:hypothetical protein Pmar_PMAR018619 [Perkinsus marinus ATCC 50983]EER09974.1 hypothetical protein Pmar_PMAR018619 [Perkinsus marinus ATCC 50983]|eukprot:XP_002778179.1 hypothetical protein Pmar_PMAR018619 [Perkinsus marinus ATCC 50983]
MADTHIHSLPLEIKAFDGQSSHQANYIGSTTMEEDDDDEPMMEDDCERRRRSPSTAESDGKADDDEEDDEDWETSSLAEYTTEELSYIRDLMAMPRGALSEL